MDAKPVQQVSAVRCPKCGASGTRRYSVGAGKSFPWPAFASGLARYQYRECTAGACRWKFKVIVEVEPPKDGGHRRRERKGRTSWMNDR